MNAIRQVQELNKRELENVVPPEASWHADYRDTAYIYIGSLPYDLSEGDLLTIFSQYGEPVHLNLVRDKETGKSKGFAFLKYEDQRSTDLAVDNLGGATILGRMIRVDHVRYKRKEEEGLEDNVATLTGGETGRGESRRDSNGGEGGRRRTTKHSESDTDMEDRRIQQKPLLKEEKELQKLIEEHDDEDPMKEYLIQEKREEKQNIAIATVTTALIVEDIGTIVHIPGSEGDSPHDERGQGHHHSRENEDVVDIDIAAEMTLLELEMRLFCDNKLLKDSLMGVNTGENPDKYPILAANDHNILDPTRKVNQYLGHIHFLPELEGPSRHCLA